MALVVWKHLIYSKYYCCWNTLLYHIMVGYGVGVNQKIKLAKIGWRDGWRSSYECLLQRTQFG